MVYLKVNWRNLILSKILIILGMYQPRPSANGICIEKIANELIKRKHSVDCISNAEQNSSKIENINGINIYRIKPRLTYRIDEWCEYNKTNKLQKFVKIVSTLMNKIKLFMSAFTWPLVSPLYTYRFYNKANKLQRQNNYDIVIGVYTPVDSVYAAHLLKSKFSDLVYIPYFLDSLSGGYGPKYFSGNLIRERCLKLEKKLVKNADLIVSMESSREHNNIYNHKNLTKTRFLDIPLLEKIICNGNNENGKDGINIIFVGSISKSTRDPEFLIKVLEKLLEKNILVSFIGAVDCIDQFGDILERYPEKIKFSGRVTHEKALEEMAFADALINIGNSNPSMVPSKIFEYMSSGKPIISTYSIKNEPSLKYLKEYQLALSIDESRIDYENIANEIYEFLTLNKNQFVDFTVLKKIFYKNTPEAFVDAILER